MAVKLKYLGHGILGEVFHGILPDGETAVTVPKGRSFKVPTEMAYLLMRTWPGAFEMMKAKEKPLPSPPKLKEFGKPDAKEPATPKPKTRKTVIRKP